MCDFYSFRNKRRIDLWFYCVFSDVSNINSLKFCWGLHNRNEMGICKMRQTFWIKWILCNEKIETVIEYKWSRKNSWNMSFRPWEWKFGSKQKVNFIHVLLKFPNESVFLGWLADAKVFFITFTAVLPPPGWEPH